MQATNSYATGAGGPDFERRVATGFVCSALVGVPLPILDDPPTKIWLQAAHLNCGFDDIVLEDDANSKSQHRVYVSVKSTISPRPSDPEFVDVISKAWSDWQAGSSFDRSKDFFLLVAATSRSTRIPLLGKLTDIARASGDRADFEHRLSLEGYNHSSVRELLPEIAGIIQKETQAAPDGESLRQLLRRFFVTTFDFDQETSQDKSRVIGILKLASGSRDGVVAISCWNAVFESLSSGTSQGLVIDAAKLESIARQHGLTVGVSDRARTWLANLRAHCRMTRCGISSLLFAKQRHIVRQGLLGVLGEALSDNKFILVTGPAGTGKSALAVEAAEKFVKPENVFCFQSEEFAHPHLDAALQAAGLRDLNAEEWTDALPFEPRVLVIEALERLFQTTGSREAVAQLLRIVFADRRWRVIFTCRDYLADHVRDTWSVPGDWNMVRIPLLESAELAEAISDSGIPNLWLEQPAVRDAMRNLKWLDLTMRAAQRITGPTPASAWATLADWRSFVWRQLLGPDVDPRGQELLVRIAVARATSGTSWVAVDHASLAIPEQLKEQGILRKHDEFPDRYRPDHDLLEDWALLFHVRREFADDARQPGELFARFGSHLLLRRAFRQFLGELLESDKRAEGISFIRRVFAEASCGKEWREEVVNALLGSSCALDALHQTRDFWTDAPGDGLRLLCHVLRIAYLGKPRTDAEPERPFGPGWNALMTFVHEQGDRFLREHTHAVTALLLDWHRAVTLENPVPQGLAAAAALVQGTWKIATEGNERFEKYWTDDKWIHPSARANRLCWLVASVAGALDSQFFRDVGREAFANRNWHVPTPHMEKNRQCRELVEFLVSDNAGWVLARAHPRAMVRLCLHAYGLREQRGGTRGGRFGSPRNCGLKEGTHDFAPPSALRGPFLELLRRHSRLGIDFILHLVNEAAYRWANDPQAADLWQQPFNVILRIDGQEFTQIADEGWWRCFRGWSPYSHIVECALMALEKWLLEDVAVRDLEHLQTTLLALVARSNNVAVTAVAAAVGGAHWWHCGKLAAVLLECWPLLGLDRARWMQDQGQGPWGGGWDAEDSSYLKERRDSNALPHRQEQLEHFILKAQFGVGQSEIWAVLDAINAELNGLAPEQVTDEIKTARLIAFRIDSRNLRIRRHEAKPDHILLQTAPPPSDLQEHLDESGKKMQTDWLPMEIQVWAAQMLEPMDSTQPQPQRWREMLAKARTLHTIPIEPERMFLFGSVPTMVAAVCLRDFSTELDEGELEWCVAQITGILFQQSDLTEWQHGSILTTWEAERGAARICGILSATRSTKAGQMAEIDKATAIALTHPEKCVRFAAAEGLGRTNSDSAIQLCACELLILHSRFCRRVDLRHRGPQRLAYEHIQTWQERCSAIHMEILTETQRLRERFVNRETPNLGRLALFYPRGHEDEQNLSPILAALLNQRSTTATAVFRRVRNWLAIQFIDEGDHWPDRRKFAADSWRDQNGCRFRSDPVNTGEVSRLVARRVLGMPLLEVRPFYSPLFKSSRICHLRGKSGEFLKDLCITLDSESDSRAFWALWESCVFTAAELANQLNNEEYWRRLKIPIGAMREAFSALMSAVFLNGMYFRPGQHWSPLDGQSDRFTRVFRGFHAFGLNPYIAFLGTVGGSLLPGAWQGISDCVQDLTQRTGKSFLTNTSYIHLLRLLAQEVSMHRVPDEDRVTWNAILHLLDVLADAGFAEAFRLRESVLRIAGHSEN
jgi:hypothetical protein